MDLKVCYDGYIFIVYSTYIIVFQHDITYKYDDNEFVRLDIKKINFLLTEKWSYYTIDYLNKYKHETLIQYNITDNISFNDAVKTILIDLLDNFPEYLL